jgi:hypothetical protein
MSSIDTNILTITEPTIELEPFEIADIESQDGEGRSKNKDKLSKQVGDVSPALRVNGYDFEKNDIIYWELNLDGFIPKMTATVIDSKGAFTVSQFPKDGEVVELYIASKDEDTFKPIRMDFDIVDVDSPPAASENQGTGSDQSQAQRITFNCTAKIPGLLAETCESYGRDTSFNHLQTISDNLKLGFASNVTETDDEQVRFCACENRLTCIQREIQHAYRDDDSFFVAHIDPYYYLNFVNLNQQLILEDNVEDTLASLMQAISERDMQDSDADKIERKLILTNSAKTGQAGSSFFIKEFSLINNAGMIALKNGYKRVVQYYDDTNREFVEFTLDTLTAENMPDNYLPLKGKSDENRYKTDIKYKYLGVQSDASADGNVHANYQYALLLNFQNTEELEKMNLKITLPTANMSLYRYQRVPVAIYEKNATRTENMRKKEEKSGIKQDTTKDAKTDDITGDKLNSFYSGYYVISKIKYIYKVERAIMEQELTLTRREWPRPI